MGIENIGELNGELAKLKEKNRELFLTNVQPAIREKVQEFLNAFEDYFRERGFVIRKKIDSVRVAYDDLHFKAFTNENLDIYIMKAKEQIATIMVKFDGEDQSNGSIDTAATFIESIDQLGKEIEKEKSLSHALLNPILFYTGSEYGPHFESPMAVLDSIFHR